MMQLECTYVSRNGSRSYHFTIKEGSGSTGDNWVSWKQISQTWTQEEIDMRLCTGHGDTNDVTDHGL